MLFQLSYSGGSCKVPPNTVVHPDMAGGMLLFPVSRGGEARVITLPPQKKEAFRCFLFILYVALL